jgi:hypothetical protein
MLLESTTITGQETIASKRQSDLLKIGVNTPEHVED